jgi:hypothetical protein
MIPAVIYTYLGASAAHIITLFTDKESALHQYDLYFMLFGLLVMTLIIWIIVRVARRELEKVIEEEENAEDNEGRRL